MVAACFRYFLPVLSPMETTQQRERYRKSSLLATVLLVTIALAIPLAITYVLTGLR